MKINRKSGFSIVELIIVIAIIGILTVLVTNNVTKSQVIARDRERLADVSTLARRLEEWYKTGGQGRYPSTVELVSSEAWRNANLKGLDPESMIAPGEGNKNSLKAASNTSKSVTPTPTTKTYVYQVRTADNQVCSSAGSKCVSFHIYYYEESTASVKRISSLHQ